MFNVVCSSSSNITGNLCCFVFSFACELEGKRVKLYRSSRYNNVVMTKFKHFFRFRSVWEREGFFVLLKILPFLHNLYNRKGLFLRHSIFHHAPLYVFLAEKRVLSIGD